MRTSALVTLTSLALLPSSALSSVATSPPPPKQCGTGISHYPFNSTLTTCLDDAILPPTAWYPWTHRPHCVQSSENPWCVFTRASSPRAHGGISVVATAEDAASAALNPLLRSFKDNDQSFFLFSTPVELPYEVRDVPGKGKGAIATRRIARGSIVLVNYASVLAAVEYPADVMREEVQELLAVAAAQLGEPERVEGLSKRGEGRHDQVGEGDGQGVEEDVEGTEMSEMEDVMLTNSFAVTVGGKEYMALFADLARFNHACKPNAFIHFSPQTLAMTIWSTRDIEIGEEITITYTSAGQTSNERKESLEKIWGFKCQCSLCTASPADVEASDARRLEIRSLQAEVLELAQKGEFRQAVKAAENLFDIVEQEGLTELLGGMYEVPARLYYHVGDLDKALEYTLKVKHELDGYGVPDEAAQRKIDMLKDVIKRIEQEIKEKEEKAN
ncbi:hypothetical protein VTI28DRAFT_656 [Corynascus sepedonium]